MINKLIICIFMQLFLVKFIQSQQLVTANAQCKEIGEQCHNHWECCSGSCLSFQYKCVRSNRPAVQSVQINPGNSVPTTSIDLINRFGGATVSNTCKANGERCTRHAECCSNSCLSFSYVCVKGSRPLISIPAQIPVIVRPGSTSISQSNLLTLTELINRFGGVDEASPSQATSGGTTNTIICKQTNDRCSNSNECCSGQCQSNFCVPKTFFNPSNDDCTSNGGKCFRDAECCSNRCHGFLHQCVT